MAPKVIQEMHKFSVVALPAPVVNMTADLELAPGVLVTRESPVTVEDFWRDQLGSVALQEIRRASLFLVSTTPTQTPSALDAEHAAVKEMADLVYLGLVISARRCSHGDGRQLTGSMYGGNCEVRQIGRRPALLVNEGVLPAEMTLPELRQSWTIGRQIQRTQGNRAFLRLRRSVDAYMRALVDPDPGVRTHQFVRSVEGWVLPDAGKTRQQFLSRTELFVGPRHHATMEKLFAIRSAEEHLNDQLEVLEAPSDREKWELLVRTAHQAQTVAQHCLCRVLSSPGLLDHFEGVGKISDFWRLPRKNRLALWGEPLNLDAIGDEFDASLVDWE